MRKSRIIMVILGLGLFVGSLGGEEGLDALVPMGGGVVGGGVDGLG